MKSKNIEECRHYLPGGCVGSWRCGLHPGYIVACEPAKVPGCPYRRNEPPLADDHFREEAQMIQPIETAPKDGSEILVYFQGIGWKSVMWIEETFDGAWCVDDGKHGPLRVRGYLSGGATHWMPLPENPA
jgi:hypothetical protein